MRKYAAAVLVLGLVITGVLFVSGTVFASKTQPQQYSIDTPEGQAIHRAMMMQVQAARAQMP